MKSSDISKKEGKKEMKNGGSLLPVASSGGIKHAERVIGSYFSIIRKIASISNRVRKVLMTFLSKMSILQNNK